MIKQLKLWAKKVKQEIHMLQLALSEPTVPWYAKALIYITLAYALSPIDLVPDFIPVLGLLDDLILLPGLMVLAVYLMPKEVVQHCRARAAVEPFRPSKSVIGGIAVILLWAALAYAAWYWWTKIHE